MKNFTAGLYRNQGTYKSFQPSLINRQWTIEDMEVLTLLGKADRELGRLDMYSEYVPNIELFTSMHVLKEATLSTRIEGTRTNVEEALLAEDEVPAERRADWEEVQNYVKALRQAVHLLNELPFSSRLIKKSHNVLLQGVRGKNKLPGQFRRSQNWIGGHSIQDALFIPPVPTEVAALMNDLEKFAHNDAIHFPELLRIALIHYQFETIHPFLDGNGRVGRLMITLYLVSKGILKRPVLYLSDFLEKKRALYYDNLMRVRTHNDIGQWFRFFLQGIVETAQNGIITFDKILKLQKETEEKLHTLGGRAVHAYRLMDYLYTHPLIDVERAKEAVGRSLSSTYKLVNDLEKLGVLTEITGNQRGKTFIFKEYLDLFR